MIDCLSGLDVKITDGNQGAGKVLTSDVDGVASWQEVSGGVTPYTLLGMADVSCDNQCQTDGGMCWGAIMWLSVEYQESTPVLCIATGNPSFRLQCFCY